ncbi:MAG: shikimate kinase [archaeon]
MRSAEAVAHGAATVVNAISTGRGAAIGVDLWTRAKVNLNRNPGEITVTIEDDPHEPTRLVTEAVRKVLEHHGKNKTYGADVETRSNIPIARGMKSSSVAANAVTLATTAALGRKIRDKEILEISVEAAITAGVTITGAYDDASASYYGGLVVTDNTQRRILRRRRISEDYRVLFHVPPQKSYTADADPAKYRKLAPISRVAHRMVLSGQHWEALILNGLAHSFVLGWNPNVAIEAMCAGAVASGLSGKGPATVAIAKRNSVLKIRSALSKFRGQLIETRLNNEKAGIAG